MHWKKSLLVTDKFLRLFVNTLPANDKHYQHNQENLAQPIKMQLCQKQKSFFQFPFAFLKSIVNYKHMPEKMTLIADIFPEIPALKNMVR